ncbi:DUF2169 family type VI secretion system accessory protein [Nannocystis bainbridge]|uniref:DUF2169 domain-containing protein n=1 Tax=Nannocystis bainbridge TaxID=2995303 RepID=A0ABT5EC03_9BACT|nr:DUF2169 domain-containing protein [Nannocystis bainbridge]MDC0723397.1 DUF2169 domain-containing protein [Nannocystis bainbridge]
MRQVETRPSPTVQQVSDMLPSGEPMLAVLAKRTYDVGADGRCSLADEQAPLLAAPLDDPDVPDLLLADSDLHPYKPRTDLVLLGHAHGRQRVRRLEVLVRVPGHEHRIAVIGARTCSIEQGKLRFSDPLPIDKVPLSPLYAYGGRDRGAEARHGNPLASPEWSRALAGADPDALSPYRYPRNPVGRGYLLEVDPGHDDAFELPQLEDPTDLLTPTRIVGDWLDNWHRLPLPHAGGWVHYDWYPRIAFAGMVPIVEHFDEPPLEVERELVPDLLADGTGRTVLDFRYEIACGAPLGLQVPHLRGGEPVELHGVHPTRPRWGFTVPPAPRLHTDGRDGRLNPAEPVLHTVVIEPDLDRITLVWRGAAPARRQYHPQELESMPLRVDWRE